MRIYCSDLQCKRDTLFCVYKCQDIKDCSSYYHHYDDIKDQLVLPFYIEKYGEFNCPVPNALIKKQKAEKKKEQQIKKEQVNNEPPKKRGRKPNPATVTQKELRDARRIAKAENKKKKEEAKVKRDLELGVDSSLPKKRGRKPNPNKIVPIVTEPKRRGRPPKEKVEETIIPNTPKRTRRTKEEMKEFRKQQALLPPEPPKKRGRKPKEVTNSISF